MSIFSNPRKFISNPGKMFCRGLGINHKKQTIVDPAAQQRSIEMNYIRQNNLYVKKAKEYGSFGDLEEAIDYKDWLVSNGPGNINSPYFSCYETRAKQGTRVVGFKGHPNEYVSWEDRFDYDAYQRDLNNAQNAINQCKQQIQDESHQYRSAINDHAYQKKGSESELANAKKLYQYAQNEYNALAQRNQHLNQQISEQQSSLQAKRSDASFKTTELAQLCSKINKAHNTNLNIYNTDTIIDAFVELTQKCDAAIGDLTNDQRTKLFFKDFGTERGAKMSSSLLNKGINLDLLAYLAVKSNNQVILKYALAEGASLDEYFVEGKTIIEHMIEIDLEHYKSILLNYKKGMFCTVINAAENNRIDILQELYKLNNEIFISNDNSTCRTILHLMVLNDHFNALDYMLSTNPDAIDVESLSGDSLLKTSLNSASQEMSIFLMSRMDHLDSEIKDLIINDECELVIKAMSIYEFDAQTRISIINFALQFAQFDLVQELLTDPEEIKQIFNDLLTEKDFILAGKFYRIFQNNEISKELDKIINVMELPEEANDCFEYFMIDSEVTLSECIDLMGMEDNIVSYEYND